MQIQKAPVLVPAHLNIIILAALLLSTSCSKPQPVQAKQDNAPLPVTAAPVKARELRRTVQSVGTMFPFDETVISAELEGRVVDVKADLGDVVPKGAVLVNISDEEQRYLLAQNEAALRMSLERVGLKEEHDRIKDIRETSEVRRAQADMFDAEQRYKRTKSLVDQGIGAQADYDQALARLNSAKAAYESALNSTRNLVQDIERQRAALDLQRKKLRDATVYAPFTGAVKDRQVNTGQYVRPNTPLFTLVKIDPIRLRLDVPERFAPWIKAGQIMEVEVEAYQGRKFSGKVWRISPTVDQTKRTFIVEALVENSKSELKPGSYARALLPTDKNERVLLVPVKAVTYIFGANKTYVVRNGATVEAREVKVGDRFDNDVEILEGLQEGDLVATSQLSRLDTGVRVSINQTETAKEASAARKTD